MGHSATLLPRCLPALGTRSHILASGLHMSVLQNEVIFVCRGYLQVNIQRAILPFKSTKHIATIHKTKTLFKCFFFVGQVQQARHEMKDAQLLLLTLLSLLKISA